MNLTSELNGTRTADIFNALMLKPQRRELGNQTSVLEKGLLCYYYIKLCVSCPIVAGVFVFSCSMNALDALYSKDTKKNDIAERRKKLSELLLKEQKEFEVGLRNNF